MSREYRRARKCAPAGKRTFNDQTRFAKVVSVYDGDTITVATRLSKKEPFYEYAVRLAGIDTPELRPPRSDPHADLHREAGLKVRNHLRRLLPEGTVVQIQFGKEDKYGRLLGRVWTVKKRMFRKPRIDVDVGAHLARIGAALVYDGGTKSTFTPDALRSIVTNIC